MTPGIHTGEHDRLLTIKGNVVNSLKKIDEEMESSTGKIPKKLEKKKRKYESRLKQLDEEMANLDEQKLVSRGETTTLGEINISETPKMPEKKIKETSAERSDEHDSSDVDHPDIGKDRKADENSRTIFRRIKIRRHKKQERIDEETAGLTRVEYILLLAGVFIVSFSVLMFEIVLTRIFSVMFTYHYVFMAVSIALFGLGAGGIVLHLIWPKLHLKRKGFTFISKSALLFSLSILLLITLITSVSQINIILIYLLSFIPFFAAGLIFATVFKLFTARSSIIYFVDLIGAGIGSLAVILFIDMFGGVNTAISIGVIASVAGFIFALASRKKWVVAASLVVILILSVGLLQNLLYYNAEIPIFSNKNKELANAIESLPLDIVETRWSTFGRTDLIRDRSNPNQMYIFIDGAAPTSMYKFNGDVQNPPDNLTYMVQQQYGAYFGFLYGKKDQVLIIGPGGGRDVLAALLGGAKNITAVEVNRDTVEIVKDYSWYNGGLYTKFDNVDVVVDEGRSFLKRSDQKYDIILLGIPITKTSGSTSGYSLSENYLFTVEAIGDYFDHLTPGGRLVIIPHNIGEVYKLTSLMLKYFEERGISAQETMRRIVVAGPGGMQHAVHGTMYPAFIVRNTEYNATEAMERRDKAMGVGFSHIFVPYTPRELVDPLLFMIANGEVAPEEGFAKLPMDLSPRTDDSPFFYKFEKGMPPVLSSLLFYTLVILLMILIIPSILRLYIYKDYVSNIQKKRKHSLRRKEQLGKQFKRYGRRKFKSEQKTADNNSIHSISIAKFIFYFSLIGMGFMLIEISLFQKLILFLGHPTSSVSNIYS